MEIYTNSNFSSYDLDFIPNPAQKTTKVKEVMLSMGFKEEGRYFKHPENNYYVEFPTGPVNLGNEFPTIHNELQTSVGKLVLLTPTNCVKDRLCAYIYHKRTECFSQAIAVAHINDIDKNDLSNWAKKESNEMEVTVKKLWKDIEFLNKPITNEVIKSYLKTKETSHNININIQSEFEELTDDLIEDYIIYKLLDVEMGDDDNYYMKMNHLYTQIS